jgi:hypothetical protein
VPIGKASRWLHLPMAEASISWPCTKMSILRVVTSPMRSISDKKNFDFRAEELSLHILSSLSSELSILTQKKLQSCLHRVTHHPCHCVCCINAWFQLKPVASCPMSVDSPDSSGRHFQDSILATSTCFDPEDLAASEILEASYFRALLDQQDSHRSWCPSSLAKLVPITPMSLWFMEAITN